MFKIINIKKNIKFISLFLLLIIFFSYFYLSNIENKEFFIIEKVNNKFYTIPEDLGGKNIPDFGINILENEFYQYINKNKINLSDDVYSLQIIVSKNINQLIFEKNNLIDKKLFNSDDFFIKKFQSNLGISYILLYNSYINRNNAHIECNKILLNNIKCIIVNISNLE